MAKVDLVKALEGIHGKIGTFLFKTQHGKQIVMPLPDYSHRAMPRQLEAQKPVMQRASQAWTTLKADNPVVAAAYAAKAKQLKRSVFSLFYDDCCNPPSVQEVDVSRYSGVAGQKITARVEDVFDVREVQVTIRASGGGVLESGLAAKSKPTGDWWVYLAQSDLQLTAGTTVEATALNWAGNRNSRVQLLPG
jgi:hypothetical protein